MPNPTDQRPPKPLTPEQRESLRKFFERHSCPPWLDGPHVARYYSKDPS